MAKQKQFMASCADCEFEKQTITKAEAKKLVTKHSKDNPEHDVSVFGRGWIIVD